MSKGKEDGGDLKAKEDGEDRKEEKVGEDRKEGKVGEDGKEEQVDENVDLNESVTFEVPSLGTLSYGRTPERRRQTMAMFSCSLYFYMPMTFLCWTLTAYLLFLARDNPLLSFACAAYLGWAYLLDKSSTDGSRKAYFRTHLRSWWAHACDYFPVVLVKTAELDPAKKYVMGYHPHGIISVGAFTCFATDGAQTISLADKKQGLYAAADEGKDTRGFSYLFPGINRRLITLPQNFATPFLREYTLNMGCCDSSKETFRSILASGPGSAIVVVVGGAAESMIVKEGAIQLVLEKRKGFVREAIMGGACLVPIISFGENDVYQIYEAGDHWVARVQYWVKKVTGVAMPIFKGRSIFFRDFGFMPRRKPIAVVVGAPIEPPKLDDARRASFKPQFDRKSGKPLNEDGELVEKMHSQYVKSLRELYAAHKDAQWNIPGRHRVESLRIK